MGYFLQAGDTFRPAPSRDALLDGLPVGNYTVEQDPTGGMFFARAEPFKPLGRLYGELDRWADRFLTTFEDRDCNTGVMLVGEKGSGKSLLGRLTSLKAAELGMPTILINQQFPGDALSGLLGSLSQPALIFLDEFEKVYNRTDVQESILTLLDGTSSTKHLFVLTVNDVYRVDNHMKNRPGRLFYNLKFSGLEEIFIREYCQDKLANQNELEPLVKIATLFSSFNFDMLKALVEEMNRYDESAAEAVKMLNITPDTDATYYTVTVQDKNKVEYPIDDDQWYGSPLFLDSHAVDLSDPDNPEEREANGLDPLKEWQTELMQTVLQTRTSGEIEFCGDDLKSLDAKRGVYVFETGPWTITLSSPPVKTSMTHWASAL